MALYAIADLHLSESVEKPMDVFGGAWTNYREKIINNLAKLTDEDVLIVAGDLSWGINLNEALADFKLLDGFKGKKLLVKGNHDLWWGTVSKMKSFFAENGIETIDFLHNNCYIYDGIALCGTRGWFFEEEKSAEHDKKMINREMMRLEASLKAAKAQGADTLYCFLHYPPLYQGYRCNELIEIMQNYNAAKCFYGHLHGFGHNLAVQGLRDGIEYKLVSADFLAFNPMIIKKS